MPTTDNFTDAAGNVFVAGAEIEALRAVGFQHRHPCPSYAIAAVSIGPPYGCDCGGTVLMGWRDWWPLPSAPHVSLVIEFDDSTTKSDSWDLGKDEER